MFRKTLDIYVYIAIEKTVGLYKSIFGPWKFLIYVPLPFPSP